GMGTAAGAESRPLLWLHALELSARKAGEKDFVKDKTQRYNIEVFRDEKSGNLLYVSETGSIAMVPGTQKAPPTTVKDPTFRMALEVPVRKAGEKEFTDKTTRFNIEVFKDE